jgi:hypothetical protein
MRTLVAVTATACTILLGSGPTALASGNGNRGNPNPGIAERVRELEVQNARQRARIQQLEQRPNVAGKSCLEGFALVGFESDGTLICETPWPSISPGPNGNLRCLEHFDPISAAGTLMAFLNTNSLPELRTYVPLPVRGSGQTGTGVDFVYRISSDVWTSLTEFGAAFQLVEMKMEEPCVDAIRGVIYVANLRADGVAEVDLGGLGSIQSHVQVELRDVVLEFLLPLSHSNLDGAPVGTTADRRPITSDAAATVVSGGILVTLDDSRFEDFPEIATILADAYGPPVFDEMFDQIVPQARLYMSQSLHSPVTVQVVGAP